MSGLVLCFSGRIGSGKTSVSRKIADRVNGSWTGFGDFIRDRAAAESLDATSREVLQDLGQRLLNTLGARWLCEQVIARANWPGNGVLIVDGVRHVNVADCIREIVSPNSALFVHLELKDGIERSRDLTDSTRARAEAHSTEQDVLSALPSYADLVIPADGTLDDTVQAVMDSIEPFLIH